MMTRAKLPQPNAVAKIRERYNKRKLIRRKHLAIAEVVFKLTPKEAMEDETRWINDDPESY